MKKCLLFFFSRKGIKTALCTLTFIAIGWFCKKETDGFTVAKVSSSLPFHAEWEASSPSNRELQEIKTLLSQPFTYLGKGAQTFVFASADGKYVLKLFRHHRMRTPFWMPLLPIKRLKERARKLEAKLHKDFMSYKIAYEEMKEETGLVFLHLNKTNFLSQTITLRDKIGVRHDLPLDDLEFLVQKRATLLYPSLEQLMVLGKKEEAKKALSELVYLLAKRCLKGITDKDPDLNTNFGLLEGRPIQIDIGRFKKSLTPPYSLSSPKEEITRITDNLHQWLMEKYPELDEHLRQTIETL